VNLLRDVITDVLFRLSALVPVFAETGTCTSDEHIQSALSQHVDTSLRIHWSMVFFHTY